MISLFWVVLILALWIPIAFLLAILIGTTLRYADMTDTRQEFDDEDRR